MYSLQSVPCYIPMTQRSKTLTAFYAIKIDVQVTHGNETSYPYYFLQFAIDKLHLFSPCYLSNKSGRDDSIKASIIFYVGCRQYCGGMVVWKWCRPAWRHTFTVIPKTTEKGTKYSWNFGGPVGPGSFMFIYLFFGHFSFLLKSHNFFDNSFAKTDF